MKKICILLLASLFVFALASCTGENIGNNNDLPPVPEDNGYLDWFDESVVLNETVINVSDDGIGIVATGLEYTKEYGVRIKLKITNGRDYDIYFEIGDGQCGDCRQTAIINGVAVGHCLSKTKVPAKTTVDTYISFRDSTLQMFKDLGISKIASVLFEYTIFFDENMYDIYYTSNAWLYTSAYPYEQKLPTDGEVIYQSEDFKVIGLGFDYDSPYREYECCIVDNNNSDLGLGLGNDRYYVVFETYVNGSVNMHEEHHMKGGTYYPGELLFGNSFVAEDKLEYRIIIKERNTYGKVIWDSGLVAVEYKEP